MGGASHFGTGSVSDLRDTNGNANLDAPLSESACFLGDRWSAMDCVEMMRRVRQKVARVCC